MYVLVFSLFLIWKLVLDLMEAIVFSLYLLGELLGGMRLFFVLWDAILVSLLLYFHFLILLVNKREKKKDLMEAVLNIVGINQRKPGLLSWYMQVIVFYLNENLKF